MAALEISTIEQPCVEIDLASVIYRDDLYPRQEKNPATVQKYAEDLSILPPIEINQNHILIDGWHRWTAHKKCEAARIRARITETKSEAQLLELAIVRNAAHGLQLSQSDKKANARRIYHATHDKDRSAKKKELARILSVSERTVNNWLSRIDKDAKDERNKRIQALWMACYTQDEIAQALEIPKGTVDTVCLEMEKLPISSKPVADHQADFTIPLYNVWKQQSKSGDLNHFGNSESTFVDNLLYLYTSPLDIVVDPFAGSGSTIDVCKKRYRRYWCGDRKPIVERESEIRRHDVVTDGLPDLKGRWKDVKLVYLDPPYWRQAQGKYSQDATDFGNMDAEGFHAKLAALIGDFSKKLPAAHIALIIQPTQWKSDNRTFVDHVAEIVQRVKLPLAMRIQAPYESQQCTAQMVEWAKENRQVLVLSREIVVWRVA